eukprot:3450473-Ditylum_brightwellii.AAC.1
MHSVLMGNKAVGVPHKSKDIDSGKEAIVEEEKKEPSNEFSVMLKGQKRAPSKDKREHHHLLTLMVSSNGVCQYFPLMSALLRITMSWKK